MISLNCDDSTEGNSYSRAPDETVAKRKVRCNWSAFWQGPPFIPQDKTTRATNLTTDARCWTGDTSFDKSAWRANVESWMNSVTGRQAYWMRDETGSLTR